jgi:RND family efflux transporter MFP subunit
MTQSHYTKIHHMRIKILALVAVAVFVASCGTSKKDSSGELNDKRAKLQELKGEQTKLKTEIDSLEAWIVRNDPNASKAGKAKLVALAPVQTAQFEHFVDLQGRIDAENISYVAPPNGQGGIVTALYVKQGQYVRKGQLLARLDDQLIRQNIEPLRVQLSAAEDTYRRTKKLWDEGIGTYQNVLNAQTQVESLRKQIGIVQRQASLMNVVAPSSGVADQVNVRVGEAFVGATANGPQISIVNTSSLKVVANVPENYMGRIGEGSTVMVQLPNTNRAPLELKVKVAGKVIDPNSRSFQIEAPIPTDPDFKPNQIAIVKIRDYAAANAITIPLNTLQNDEQGKFVMVAVKEGNRQIARKRRVIIGELYGDRLEVKSGLQAGDILVVQGFQELYEGQPLITDVNAK